MNIVRYTGHYQKLIASVREYLGLSYEAIGNEKGEKPTQKQIEAAAEKAAATSELGSSNFVKRIHQRAIQKEIDRQDNIDNILDKSINYLQDNVSEKPVSKDWKSKFFNEAQDVSNVDIQEIWAKIFADEVANPGSISSRTLEVLSSLSKNEAIIFQKILGMTIDYRYILKINSENNFSDFEINYDDLLVLRAAGLLFEGDNLNYSYGVNYQPDFPPEIAEIYPQTLGIVDIKMGDKIYKVKKNSLVQGPSKYTFDTFILTPSGTELAKTMIISFNKNYFDKLIEKMRLDGYEVN